MKYLPLYYSLPLPLLLSKLSNLDTWSINQLINTILHALECMYVCMNVLVGKPEGKRPLGRPRHRWVDNIRMDLQEVGCGYMDWIGMAQDKDRWRTLVSAVMNLRVP